MECNLDDNQKNYPFYLGMCDFCIFCICDIPYPCTKRHKKAKRISLQNSKRVKKLKRHEKKQSKTVVLNNCNTNK